MNNQQTTTSYQPNLQGLSKKDRRRLRKEQKQLTRAKEARTKQLIKWGSILGVALLLMGGFFLFNYLKTARYQNASQIQLTPSTYDFGQILASQGSVTTSFQVQNTGTSPLVISGMETSCGCTTARLKTKDQETSPVFGMHNNPTNWSTSLEPETTAELTVTFDPNFHQDSFGPITRTVSIFSNDPGKSKQQVTIFANVKP